MPKYLTLIVFLAAASTLAGCGTTQKAPSTDPALATSVIFVNDGATDYVDIKWPAAASQNPADVRTVLLSDGLHSVTKVAPKVP